MFFRKLDTFSERNTDFIISSVPIDERAALNVTIRRYIPSLTQLYSTYSKYGGEAKLKSANALKKEAWTIMLSDCGVRKHYISMLEIEKLINPIENAHECQSGMTFACFLECLILLSVKIYHENAKKRVNHKTNIPKLTYAASFEKFMDEFRLLPRLAVTDGHSELETIEFSENQQFLAKETRNDALAHDVSSSVAGAAALKMLWLSWRESVHRLYEQKKSWTFEEVLVALHRAEAVLANEAFSLVHGFSRTLPLLYHEKTISLNYGLLPIEIFEFITFVVAKKYNLSNAEKNQQHNFEDSLSRWEANSGSGNPRNSLVTGGIAAHEFAEVQGIIESSEAAGSRLASDLAKSPEFRTHMDDQLKIIFKRLHGRHQEVM
jgi:hypothetical protein